MFKKQKQTWKDRKKGGGAWEEFQGWLGRCPSTLGMSISTWEFPSAAESSNQFGMGVLSSIHSIVITDHFREANTLKNNSSPAPAKSWHFCMQGPYIASDRAICKTAQAASRARWWSSWLVWASPPGRASCILIHMCCGPGKCSCWLPFDGHRRGG